MLDIQEKDNVEIVNMIYEIRGQQVMLDSDLNILEANEAFIKLFTGSMKDIFLSSRRDCFRGSKSLCH